jgi:hypothetical protein
MAYHEVFPSLPLIAESSVFLMTMLDRMRRHKGWLKWSLGLVVVTFVVLYIPFSPGSWMATAGHHRLRGWTAKITAEFRRISAQLQVPGRPAAAEPSSS